MAGSSAEWIFIALFFACFFAVTIGEIWWLSRRSGVDVRRAMILVFSSNFVTITIGFFISFVFIAVLLSISVPDAAGAGKIALSSALIISVIFPFGLMVGLRTVLVRVLRLENFSERFERPFRYAVLSGATFLLIAGVLPVASLFLLRWI